MIKFKWVFKSQVSHKNANEGIHALFTEFHGSHSRLRLACLLCKQPGLKTAQGHWRVPCFLPALCDRDQNVHKEKVDTSPKTSKNVHGGLERWLGDSEWGPLLQRTQILLPALRSVSGGAWHAWPQRVRALTCINLYADTVLALIWRFVELIYWVLVAKNTR